MISPGVWVTNAGELAFERATLESRVKIRLFKPAETASHADAALFARFLAGDDAAFTSLYSAHNQRLFNYCAKMLRDHDAAQDIVHTMWERVIAMRVTSQSADIIRNPVGLFVRIARNLSLDHLKHHARQTTLDDASAMQIIAKSEDEELVLRAIERLPDETREIIVLHYYSGYDFNEIAQMLGKKPNAIWTRVSRARAELKKILERELKGVTQ
jgi:RNA polymerase sigma factor (sigma-70 family)